MDKLKICPDLTSYETKESILVGHGTCTMPVLHVCLKEKCVAYDSKFNMCDKYKNNVIYDDGAEEWKKLF